LAELEFDWDTALKSGKRKRPCETIEINLDSSDVPPLSVVAAVDQLIVKYEQFETRVGLKLNQPEQKVTLLNKNMAIVEKRRGFCNRVQQCMLLCWIELLWVSSYTGLLDEYVIDRWLLNVLYLTRCHSYFLILK
jgi:hypothetical protein